MSITLYVAGLTSSITELALRDLFAPYGPVRAVRIPADRVAGRPSRGFGFVVFEDLEAARAAIAELDGRRLGERVLSVRVARPSPTYSRPCARSSVPSPNDHRPARRFGNG